MRRGSFRYLPLVLHWQSGMRNCPNEIWHLIKVECVMLVLFAPVFRVQTEKMLSHMRHARLTEFACSMLIFLMLFYDCNGCWFEYFMPSSGVKQRWGRRHNDANLYRNITISAIPMPTQTILMTTLSLRKCIVYSSAHCGLAAALWLFMCASLDFTEIPLILFVIWLRHSDMGQQKKTCHQLKKKRSVKSLGA